MNLQPAPDPIGAILDEIKDLNPLLDADRMVAPLRRLADLIDKNAKPKKWAAARARLGGVLKNCTSGDVIANREEAIGCLEDAVSTFDPGDAFMWTHSHLELAGLYAQRPAGDPEANLEQAVRHYDECLKQIDHPDVAWLAPMAHYGAGFTYINRIAGDHAANVERAIAEFEAAARGYDPGDAPAEWVEARIKLAGSYRQREGGDPAENIEMAMAAYAEALQVCTRDSSPLGWATLQNLMGGTWLTRLTTPFERNAEEAIACHSASLTAIVKFEHPIEWADTQRQLGDALQMRVHGDRAESLERAIDCYRQAIECAGPERSPNSYALTQMNLAGALGMRKLGDRAANLHEAIRSLEAAQAIFSRDPVPIRWAAAEAKLGAAYADLCSAGEAGAIDQVETHCRRALEVLPKGSDPAERRRIYSILADALFRDHRWLQAQAAFEGAIEEGEALFTSAYTPAGRQEAIWHVAGFYPQLAWCHLQQGKPGEALETLEKGKLRALASTLDEDVSKSPAEFRAAPNPDVLPPYLDVRAIRSLTPEGGALVFPIFTSEGSASFLLTSAEEGEEVEVVPHASLNKEDVLEILRGKLDAGELGGWLADYSFQRSQPDRWLRALEEIGGVLWERIFGAVHERLRQLGLKEGAPLVLLLQGGLGLMPVHLAWRLVDGVKRYLLDDYTVSYSPSAAALLVSRLRLRYRQSRLTRSLLAVVDPTGDLPYARVEAALAGSQFSDSTRELLVGANATVAAATASLAQRGYLHFCCHGSYDWNDQLNGGLLLADGGRLTISRVLGEIRLPDSRLVVLSACETGLFKVTGSPDEFIGLPATFIRAGAPGVVSSQWRVADISTAFLMARLYERSLDGGLEPAQALREAQLWLRGATGAELARELMSRARQEWKTVSPAWRSLALKPADKPFAHPFYWGAFTMTGA